MKPTWMVLLVVFCGCVVPGGPIHQIYPYRVPLQFLEKEVSMKQEMEVSLENLDRIIADCGDTRGRSGEYLDKQLQDLKIVLKLLQAKLPD